MTQKKAQLMCHVEMGRQGEEMSEDMQPTNDTQPEATEEPTRKRKKYTRDLGEIRIYVVTPEGILKQVTEPKTPKFREKAAAEKWAAENLPDGRYELHRRIKGFVKATQRVVQANITEF